MAQRNSGSVADELKSQLNIVDVVGRVVPLKRAGSNYKGVCPFHSEKTPSFVVSDQKQIFTCFGCGATGDVIEFTKRYYNLDFIEACEKLGKEYGIEVDFSHSSPNKEKEEYYKINREAAAFLHEQGRFPRWCRNLLILKVHPLPGDYRQKRRHVPWLFCCRVLLTS